LEAIGENANEYGRRPFTDLASAMTLDTALDAAGLGGYLLPCPEWPLPERSS
jgi:hypothetical protein